MTDCIGVVMWTKSLVGQQNGDHAHVADLHGTEIDGVVGHAGARGFAGYCVLCWIYRCTMCIGDRLFLSNIIK